MDEKMFDLMSKMYGEMQKGFKRIDVLEHEIKGIKNEVQGIKEDMQGIKEDMATKKDIIKIEIEHGKKLDALFDGYKQNSEQLTRIENEVKRHDDFILRRVN